MSENEISFIVVSKALHIHKELGPGLLESVYEVILCEELRSSGLEVKRQVALPVIWKSKILEQGFRLDLLVENTVICEIKSVEIIHPVYAYQLLTYLKLSNKKLGLLINFNSPLLKDGIKRVVNGL
jgi:GxxExxY protein